MRLKPIAWSHLSDIRESSKKARLLRCAEYHLCAGSGLFRSGSVPKQLHKPERSAVPMRAGDLRSFREGRMVSCPQRWHSRTAHSAEALAGVNQRTFAD